MNETPCSAANVFKNGTVLPVFGQVSFGTKHICKSGIAWGPITDLGDEGKVATQELTFASWGCEQQGTIASCSLSMSNLPYNIEFEGSEGNGTMRLSDPTELIFKVQCNAPGQTCTYSTKEQISYGFTGGNPAVMTATSVPVSSGEGCPTTTSMELKSGVPPSSPQSLFIVGGPAPMPRFCEVNTSPCPEPNRYPIGTAIEGTLEGDSVFEFLYEGKPREPWCESGAITGKTNQANVPLIGEVSAMSFKKCGGGVCAVEAQSLPYKAEIEKTTGGNGTMNLLSSGAGSPKIEVNASTKRPASASR